MRNTSLHSCFRNTSRQISSFLSFVDAPRFCSFLACFFTCFFPPEKSGNWDPSRKISPFLSFVDAPRFCSFDACFFHRRSLPPEKSSTGEVFRRGSLLIGILLGRFLLSFHLWMLRDSAVLSWENGANSEVSFRFLSFVDDPRFCSFVPGEFLNLTCG